MYDDDDFVDDPADPDWGDDDEDNEVLACPSCRKPVYEDTEKCPHCGDWITPVYPQAGSKRMLTVVVVVLLVAALLLIAVF